MFNPAALRRSLHNSELDVTQSALCGEDTDIPQWAARREICSELVPQGFDDPTVPL